jgi:hypothetical protein
MPSGGDQPNTPAKTDAHCEAPAPAASWSPAPPLALPGTLPGLREWLVLGFLVLVCLVYWGFHYHSFFLPPVDTPAFITTSRELWSFSLPGSFKRMPLFPLLIGLVGKCIPAEEPELEAALALNLLFSAGSIVLLYMFARNIIGWAAMVPVAFVAFSTVTHNMAVQPLVEPIMGFSILLSLWLFQRRSRWRYLALFFAALTRYENAGLIAVIFALDWIYDRRLWKPLLLSAAASSGFLLWMTLSVFYGKSSGGNPYVAQMQNQGWAMCPEFIWRVVEVSFCEWGALGLGLLAAGGIVLSWRRCRRESAALVAFSALYIIVHVLFAMNRSRYVYPIRWVLPLYLGLCLVALIELGRAKLSAQWQQRLLWTLASTGALVAVASVAYTFNKLARLDGVAHKSVYLAFVTLVLVGLLVYAAVSFRASRLAAAAVAFLLVALAAPQASRGIPRHAKDSWSHRYRRYGSFLAGRWMKEKLAAGEKALAPHAALVATCAELKSGRILPWSVLEAGTLVEARAELVSKGIAYVVYTDVNIATRGDAKYPRQARKYRPDLLQHFERGGDVPGFEHVAALSIPRQARRRAAQIYRILPLARTVTTSRGSAQ